MRACLCTAGPPPTPLHEPEPEPEPEIELQPELEPEPEPEIELQPEPEPEPPEPQPQPEQPEPGPALHLQPAPAPLEDSGNDASSALQEAVQVWVSFTEPGQLGLSLVKEQPSGVTAVSRAIPGTQACEHPEISPGMVLLQVGSTPVTAATEYLAVLKLMRSEERPLRLAFFRSAGHGPERQSEKARERELGSQRQRLHELQDEMAFATPVQQSVTPLPPSSANSLVSAGGELSPVDMGNYSTRHNRLLLVKFTFLTDCVLFCSATDGAAAGGGRGDGAEFQVLQGGGSRGGKSGGTAQKRRGGT